MHPGMTGFYLTTQQGPSHRFHGGLGPNSQFDAMDCHLTAGEAVIIIGHGGDDMNLYNHRGQIVSDAAGRLMAQIAKVNPEGGYNIFLAACGGAAQQLNKQASLLSTLIDNTQQLKNQLKLRRIECWSYTVEAGFLDLERGVPADRIGKHIYGVLNDGKEYHSGYDTSLTTQLLLREEGGYTITSSPKVRIPFEEVITWYIDDNGVPGMETKFKDLYDTLIQTK
jgi:hypothetical protein